MRAQISDRMTNEGSVLGLCSTSKPVCCVPWPVALSVLSVVSCPKRQRQFHDQIWIRRKRSSVPYFSQNGDRNYSCHLLYLLLKNAPNDIGRIMGQFMNFLFLPQTSDCNCFFTLVWGHPWLSVCLGIIWEPFEFINLLFLTTRIRVDNICIC